MFCQQYELTPIPMSECVFCLFVAYLTRLGMNPSSISTYLAAMRHLQVKSGHPLPQRMDWPHLQYTLKGIKRSQSTSSKRYWLPITSDIMQVILSSLQRDRSNNQYSKDLLWAACCAGFFGFLQAGEFMLTQSVDSYPLQAADLSVNSHSAPTLVRILLCESKTDVMGQGVYIYFGKAEQVLWLVTALLQYISMRPPHHSQLFIWQDGQPLTRDQFIVEVKALLPAANYISSSYAGHSFRIGAATTAALVGLPVHMIKTLGCWKSEAYQLYIRTPPHTLAAMSRRLANPGSSPPL